MRHSHDSRHAQVSTLNFGLCANVIMYKGFYPFIRLQEKQSKTVITFHVSSIMLWLLLDSLYCRMGTIFASSKWNFVMMLLQFTSLGGLPRLWSNCWEFSPGFDRAAWDCCSKIKASFEWWRKPHTFIYDWAWRRRIPKIPRLWRASESWFGWCSKANEREA